MTFYLKGIAAALATLTLSFAGASAQDYPSRPVHIVVPYSPGGPSDLSARLFGEALQERLGQPVVIENRGGAGGRTGTEAALNADADGYTLLLGAVGPLVFAPIGQDEPRRVIDQLVPLGQIWSSPQIFAARKDLEPSTLQEFVAYAKERPGELNVGSAGIGTMTHMASELFQREAGIDFEHIPYTSSGPVITDIIAGQVDVMFGDASVLAPHAEAGALKALAVTSPERSALAPDVETTTEAGFPSVATGNWYALFVQEGTPDDVVTTLQEAVAVVQEDPAYRTQIEQHGAVVGSSGADGLAELLDSEIERWTPIIEEAGIEFN